MIIRWKILPAGARLSAVVLGTGGTVVDGAAVVTGVVSPGPAGGIVVGGTVVVVSSVGRVNGAAGGEGVPFGRNRPFASFVAF